jgi:hypothetical protein
MLHPLVTLWRHFSRVTFYEAGASLHTPDFHQPQGVLGAGQLPGHRRQFASLQHAQEYLRFWAGEPAARAELAWLSCRGGGVGLSHGGMGGDWLLLLANRLLKDEVAVMEESAWMSGPGRLVVAGSGTDSAQSSAPAAALAPLESAPSLPAVVPMLPVLEEVRVEGAEVLPEVQQSMVKIDASVGQVQTASTSVEPAPGGVAAIQTSMSEAGTGAQADLDAL